VALFEKWVVRMERCPQYSGHHPSDLMLSNCLRAELRMDFIDSIEFGSGSIIDYTTDELYKKDKPLGMGFPVSFHRLKEEETRTLWAIEQLVLRVYA
jgi:hypothetical protein